MKFNEKLIELRKKQGLSQEELGYKLNVTRQTVSKWELGETTPEMAKLVEMSKIFNVSVDELTNDSEIKTNVNPIIEDQPINNEEKKDKKEKKVLIILVGLLIVVVVAIAGTAISSAKKTSIEDQTIGFFDKFFNLFDKILDKGMEMQDEIDGMIDDSEEMQNAQQNFENIFGDATNKINTSAFNGVLELYKGSNGGSQLKRLLDEVITTNKTQDKKITVKYLETESQDTGEIENIKANIKDSNNFEVIFDYDEEGYINKATIEKVVSEFEVKSFNNYFEMYSGNSNGMFVTNVLDQIITTNKTKEQKITVKYKTTETQDENEIRNIKRNFGTFDNCEITYEYDANGFINKAIIEKL